MTAYQLDAWAVLGDASRRAIIEHLSQRSCSVAELAEEMPISRPAVSQHLKVLREAGVVHDVAEGRHRVYSLDGARLARYRRQLDRFWSDALTNLAEAEEKEETHERGL